MCKVVCAMGFDPIGFMASFVSCDETSVLICRQSIVESTGCIHVSWVQGVAQAVYILDQVCAVFSSDWYMSCTPALQLLWFNQALESGVSLLWGTCDETAVRGSVCKYIQASLYMRTSCLDATCSPFDPLPWCCWTVWMSKITMHCSLMGV